MRSPTSLLVFVLSVVSFAVSSPLHSVTHSSRLAKSPISSRQFHYPRALVDVCADIDLSLLVDDVLGLNLLGDICLCLSAFPLDLSLDADLQLLVESLGQTEVEALLETSVEKYGTQCTYPDHCSPKCTSGNPCDFTCTDGFTKSGGSCVCPLPKSVCNGRCGSYQNGCTSALPRAPKMARRSIASSHNRRSPSSHSGGLLDLDALNLDGLLNGVLGSPGTTSGGNQSGNQSSGLEVVLDICIGADFSETQSLLDTITDTVNSLLSSLLGTTLECKVKSSSSASVDPDTISIDLQTCGLSSESLNSTLDQTLKAVTDLLNSLLGSVTVVTESSVGGPGCPATPTSSISSQPHPSSSTSVGSTHSSVHPSPSPTPHSVVDWSGLLNGLLSQVGGILSDLGLSSGDYNIDTGTDPVVGVSVGLCDTLSNTDGLVDTVIALVDETLRSLLGTDLTTQLNPNPTSPPTSSHTGQGDGIVVDIDLSAVLNATLSNTGDLVADVLSGLPRVLADLLNLDVVVNVDGGHDCGCSGSRSATAKN